MSYLNLLHAFVVQATDIAAGLPMDDLDGWIPNNAPAGAGKLKGAVGIILGWIVIVGIALSLLAFAVGLATAGVKKGSERGFFLKGAVGSLLIAAVLGTLGVVVQFFFGAISTVLNSLA